MLIYVCNIGRALFIDILKFCNIRKRAVILSFHLKSGSNLYRRAFNSVFLPGNGVFLRQNFKSFAPFWN